MCGYILFFVLNVPFLYHLHGYYQTFLASVPSLHILTGYYLMLLGFHTLASHSDWVLSDAFGFPYPRLIFHMGILRDFISLCPILENLINTVRPFEPATGSFSGCQATKLKLRLRLVFCLGSAWALHVPASLNSSFASLGLIKCPGTVRTKLKLRLRLVFVKCST